MHTDRRHVLVTSSVMCVIVLLTSRVYGSRCTDRCSAVFSMSHEHRLLKQTFEIYGDGCEECKLSRPIVMEPETMHVQFGIALIQVSLELKISPFNLELDF